MAEDKPKLNYNYGILAIVAIVAVVAIVVMFVNTGNANYAATEEMQQAIGEENLVGAASSGDQLPKGSLDAANCNYIAGWAFDPDKPEHPIAIHFYIDAGEGNQFFDYTVADKERADIKRIFGVDAAFHKNYPADSTDGLMLRNLTQDRQVELYAYAIGINNNGALSHRNKYLGSKTVGPCEYPEDPTNPEMDLANYPNIFMDQSGSFDGKIIVGSQAPVTDVVAAIDIASSLEDFSEGSLPIGLAVLDTEAPSIGSIDMIVMGNPCVNTVAAELMGHPMNCTEGFEPGKGKIKLFNIDGKNQVLVAGYGAQETRGTGYVLADWEDYDLKGDECETEVANLNTIRVYC